MKITSQAELDALRDAALKAEVEFEKVIKSHFPNADRWSFYRDEIRHEDIDDAQFKYVTALHKFYEARDGESGFLGGRGV